MQENSEFVAHIRFGKTKNYIFGGKGGQTPRFGFFCSSFSPKKRMIYERKKI
jgi:hypothetical protein